MSDFYKTLKGRSQGLYKEKMSKFISFAEPVASADEAKAVVKRIQNEYHDARHVCSFGLTNVVIAVVRYFGGIKLGTSGLIIAYREAARLAIESGEILECHEQAQCRFTFPYLSMNDVMRLLKKCDVRIIEQAFDNVCSMTVECDADAMPELRQRLVDIDGTSFN